MASQSSIALDRFRQEDVAAAETLLAEREAALSIVPRPESTPSPKPESPEHQAAPETATEPTTANSLPSDTPAAADTVKPPAPQQEPETQKPAEKGSAFSKDQQRLQGTWKQVNEAKSKLETDRAALQAERVRFQQDQQRFQQQQQTATKNKLTPEGCDQIAAQKAEFVETGKLQLEGLKARKARFEEAGQYTEAAKLDAQIENLTEEIAVAKRDSKSIKEMGENLRKNPDLTGDALKQRNLQHLQRYTVEACKKWPDLGVANSEFQKATSRAINILRQQGLDENEMPVLRYFAAEHVAAQSAAARVPDMEKELVKLRARVKELETNATPGGGQGAVPNLRPSPKPASLDAEGEMLRREAELKGAKG